MVELCPRRLRVSVDRKEQGYQNISQLQQQQQKLFKNMDRKSEMIKVVGNYLDKNLAVEDTSKLVDRDGRGTCTVLCSANNTHMSVVYMVGGKVFKFNKSTGRLGFKGTKRGTPHAAEQLALMVGTECKKRGAMGLDVILCGLGRGRNVITKGLVTSGVMLLTVSDGTTQAHGGCRPKKMRRV